jgi:hypothetical protein
MASPWRWQLPTLWLTQYSAVTNANPAVATTSAPHGITTGDFVEVTSGWSRLNNRIVRAASASGSSLAYEGIDSSSTVNYPVGTGTGSIRAITAFTQISQILDLTSSGGEMQFTNYSFLEQDFESQLPTQASPMSYVDKHCGRREPGRLHRAQGCQRVARSDRPQVYAA